MQIYCIYFNRDSNISLHWVLNYKFYVINLQKDPEYLSIRFLEQFYSTQTTQTIKPDC